ncbi:hypothetical protein TNCT_133221, partial [Trichonephila clavata]
SDSISNQIPGFVNNLNQDVGIDSTPNKQHEKQKSNKNRHEPVYYTEINEQLSETVTNLHESQMPENKVNSVLCVDSTPIHQPLCNLANLHKSQNFPDQYMPNQQYGSETQNGAEQAVYAYYRDVQNQHEYKNFMRRLEQNHSVDLISKDQLRYRMLYDCGKLSISDDVIPNEQYEYVSKSYASSLLIVKKENEYIPVGDLYEHRDFGIFITDQHNESGTPKNQAVFNDSNRSELSKSDGDQFLCDPNTMKKRRQFDENNLNQPPFRSKSNEQHQFGMSKNNLNNRYYDSGDESVPSNRVQFSCDLDCRKEKELTLKNSSHNHQNRSRISENNLDQDVYVDSFDESKTPRSGTDQFTHYMNIQKHQSETFKGHLNKNQIDSIDQQPEFRTRLNKSHSFSVDRISNQQCGSRTPKNRFKRVFNKSIHKKGMSEKFMKITNRYKFSSVNSKPNQQLNFGIIRRRINKNASINYSSKQQRYFGILKSNAVSIDSMHPKQNRQFRMSKRIENRSLCMDTPNQQHDSGKSMAITNQHISNDSSSDQCDSETQNDGWTRHIYFKSTPSPKCSFRKVSPDNISVGYTSNKKCDIRSQTRYVNQGVSSEVYAPQKQYESRTSISNDNEDVMCISDTPRPEYSPINSDEDENLYVDNEDVMCMSDTPSPEYSPINSDEDENLYVDDTPSPEYSPINSDEGDYFYVDDTPDQQPGSDNYTYEFNKELRSVHYNCNFNRQRESKYHTRELNKRGETLYHTEVHNRRGSEWLTSDQNETQEFRCYECADNKWQIYGSPSYNCEKWRSFEISSSNDNQQLRSRSRSTDHKSTRGKRPRSRSTSRDYRYKRRISGSYFLDVHEEQNYQHLTSKLYY